MARSRSRSSSVERSDRRRSSRERDNTRTSSRSDRYRRDDSRERDRDRKHHNSSSHESKDRSRRDSSRERSDRDRKRSEHSRSDRERSDRERDRGERKRRRSTSRSRSRSPKRESRDHVKREPRDKVKRESSSSSKQPTQQHQSSQSSNQTSGFVWAKRADQTAKTIDFEAELEAVRQRRAARAEEVANLAKLREDADRSRLAQSEAGGTMREEEFHRKQIFSRAKIRGEQGRSRPIDQLANNLLVDNSQLGDPTIVDTSAARSARLTDPLALIASLNQLDLQELDHEIEHYLEVASNEHGRYWWSIQCLCREELKSFDDTSTLSLSQSVIADIHTMIDAIQSQEEIDDMKQQIANNSISTPYWECVKHELEMHECRRYLTQHFRQLLQARLESLRNQIADHSDTSHLSIQTETDNDSKSEARASLSPRLFHPDEILDVDVVDPIDDWRDLDSARMEVMERFGTQGNSHEHVMNVSAQLTGSHAGRFKGRKPRFYNRVKTGFDWNRYNQAHYDRDNPPPKLVQGYKFTIFYPDLIEPNKAPKYSIEPDFQGDSSFCILRFVSGPPYEDLAFRIVNKDWEVAPKRGFKSSFDKGVLQLHFNFKRIFYRR